MRKKEREGGMVEGEGGRKGSEEEKEGGRAEEGGLIVSGDGSLGDRDSSWLWHQKHQTACSCLCRSRIRERGILPPPPVFPV